MKPDHKTFGAVSLKKAALLCFKISVLLGILFSFMNEQNTVQGVIITIGISGMYSFGLGFGMGFLNQFLNKKYDWIEQTNQRVWVGIIGTLLYTIPVVLLINYVLFIIVKDGNLDDFFKGNYIWIHFFYVILALGISAFLHARGFMLIWKESVTKESTKQEIVAKTETAKFESLKSQIDPHFLFNSLNVLTSLIGENPVQAEKFTTKLSKIYRYVLEQRNKDLTPLEEELQFAKTYMELLEMRFEDAVKFNIPLTVTNKDLKIVPLSLQLLLENAVKHNVVSTTKPLEIKIFEADGFLHIKNTINPKEAIGRSTKVGLRNIADRYGLITNKRVIIENNNKTFTVSLPLLTKTTYSMYQDNLENSKYVRAVERMEKLKEFYQNLTSYCIMVPVFIFINLRFSPGFHWFWFPMAGWGIGLIFHGLDAYNYYPLLGKNWEERKIKEIMDEEQKYR